MFDSLKNKASASKGRKVRGKVQDLPQTVAFVSALKTNGLRISYAALADASAELGEHIASGLSAGQRGSALLPSLPITLQPYVCRGNGNYAKGQTWNEDANAPDIAKLRSLPHVRPEVVISFVERFVEASQAEEQAPEVEETPAEEPSEESEVPSED